MLTRLACIMCALHTMLHMLFVSYCTVVVVVFVVVVFVVVVVLVFVVFVVVVVQPDSGSGWQTRRARVGYQATGAAFLRDQPDGHPAQPGRPSGGHKAAAKRSVTWQGRPGLGRAWRDWQHCWQSTEGPPAAPRPLSKT